MVRAAASVDMDRDVRPRAKVAGRTEKDAAMPNMAKKAINWDFMVTNRML
jgi:hypothetical protein